MFFYVKGHCFRLPCESIFVIIEIYPIMHDKSRINNLIQKKVKKTITTKNPNINELLEMADDKHYFALSKNDVLFKENERIKGVYFLLSGKIKIAKSGSGTGESILYFIKPPDIICLHSVIEDKFHANSASAVSDSMVCFIPNREFKKILAKNVNAAFNLMKMLCFKINVINNQISRFT